MELQGEWLGGSDGSGKSNRRKRKSKARQPVTSQSSSFLPDIVDAVNEMDPHPFRDDACAGQNRSTNVCNNEKSQLDGATPEGGVWSAYAELQSAYSALQASELSASTHLKQTNSLLEKEKKKYASLREKLSKYSNDLETAQAKLSDLMSESKETAAFLEAKRSELDAANKCIAEAQSERITAQEAQKEAEAKLLGLKNQVDSLTETSSQNEIALKSKVEALRARLMAAEEDSASAKIDLAKINDIHKKLLSKCDSNEQEATVLRAKCKSLEREIGKLEGIKESHEKLSRDYDKLEQTRGQEVVELNRIRKEHARDREKICSISRELDASRRALQREEELSREARQSRDEEIEKSASQSSLHKEAIEAAKREATERSAETIALLRDEISPLQEELKRLIPLESELSEARRVGELLQSQIGQAHQREDQLRSELSKAKEELAAMKLELTEARKVREEQSKAKAKKKAESQTKKDLELAAFKKELADVRAKQKFAVNEVKVLMAKLAAKEGRSGIQSAGVRREDEVTLHNKELQQIDFIDENLRNLKRRKGRKEQRSSNFVTSGNYRQKGTTVSRTSRNR